MVTFKEPPVKQAQFSVWMHLGGQFISTGMMQMEEQEEDVIDSNFLYSNRYLSRKDAVELDPASLAFGDGFDARKKSKESLRGTTIAPIEGLHLFGAVRDASPDAWGRRVIESRLGVPLNSLPESVYLRHVGGERIGALDFRESLDENTTSKAATSIHRLQYLIEAADRIDQGLPIPTSLEDIFDAGTSLGGMRPKVTVADDAGVLWLAKFPSQGDRLNVPMIETATMWLAKDAGLDVPEIKLATIGGQSVMMIKRFDRTYVNGAAGMEVHRAHMVSSLTMLGCTEDQSRSKNYVEIADMIRRKAPIDKVKSDSAELFGRMVFNILVSNDDDHLRNHAFLHSLGKEGKDGEFRDQGWQLSPLYDVMPRPSIGTDRYLHLGVGMQGRLATIGNAMSMHGRFGLTQASSTAIIDRIWTVVREWKTYFESYGVDSKQINLIAPAFRHMDVLR
jgi:serine/threonine-protein kinase HipA